MRVSALLITMTLLASLVGVVLHAQTSPPAAVVTPSTFGQVTISVNLWYTTPLSTYGQTVGEVRVSGIAQIHNTSAFFNFTSTGFILTPNGLKNLPIPSFVLAVFPTGRGVYVLTFNTSYVAANITNTSGNPYRSFPPLSEVLWYYNGTTPIALVKGNITSVLPATNGIYVVVVTKGKAELLQFQGATLASSRGLAEPLFLLYEGNNYLLASTSALAISPQLVEELFQVNSSVAKNLSDVKFYKLFPNGSMVSVRPDVSTANATMLVVPGGVYGANIYVVYSNGTYTLYLYDGSSTMKVATGTERFNTTTPTFAVPFVLTANGVIAYYTTTLNVYSLIGSGSSNLLTSDLQVLAQVNGSWTKYGSFSVNGLPLAMTKNGSVVTVYYLYLTPTFSYSSHGISVSISGSLMSTSIHVGGPVAFNYSVYTQTLQGKKYLVITWSKPAVKVQENVSVYISVNGGPYKLYETVPVSTGVVYFQLPANATTVSVYLVVSNPLGSMPLSAQTVSLTSTTTPASTTSSTSTKATTSTTTQTATQSISTQASSAPAASSTSSQQGISGLEIAGIAVVVIVIVAVLAFFLLRK